MQDNIIDRRSFFKLGLLGGSVVAASTIGGSAVLKAADLRIRIKLHKENQIKLEVECFSNSN